jgi:hypothetical protein
MMSSREVCHDCGKELRHDCVVEVGWCCACAEKRRIAREEPTPAKPETCALCGNTREWHRNPGKSGVHKFAERATGGDW